MIENENIALLARRYGYEVDFYDCVGSTNEVALQKAKAGHSGSLWVVAEEQNQGRGRRGRIWNSPRGNLYTSLLLKMRMDQSYEEITNFDEQRAVQRAGKLGFVAGVSIAEAIKSLLSKAGKARYERGGAFSSLLCLDLIKLKWPNDLLLGRKKAAGILLEYLKIADGDYALIIGIGVNVAHTYAGAPYPTASLQSVGIEADKGDILASLIESFSKNYALFHSVDGPDIIRAAWMKHCGMLGQKIHVVSETQTWDGIFYGLDQDYNCIIKLDGGQYHFITAGDVHFGGIHSRSMNRE
ncbi:biotin--[acetyl-CoA-carboxylase] ligase [Bartonella sp. DGB2]|uniref:biotin--[acetyl-CoA-carboxylase] ligase n=1 Tax=Bartonella sp. DGB2 TaxID=3388426 RepID=UPI0039901A95